MLLSDVFPRVNGLELGMIKLAMLTAYTYVLRSKYTARKVKE